jgi:hypothetical protein
MHALSQAPAWTVEVAWRVCHTKGASMTTPDLRPGMWVAYQRMRGMIKWRMDREDISNRVAVHVQDMLGEADDLVAEDLHSEAVAKLTNAAIYLGRYMYVS